MIDELVAGLVGNWPFALVLVYFLSNYFRERKDTLAMMHQVTKDFTTTIRACCEASKAKANLPPDGPG